jgi:hypothetical protein
MQFHLRLPDPMTVPKTVTVQEPFGERGIVGDLLSVTKCQGPWRKIAISPTTWRSWAWRVK